MPKGWSTWDGPRTARLRALMAQGATPRLVADALGVTYEGARSRMKKLRAEERAQAGPSPTANLRAPEVKRGFCDANGLNAISGRPRVRGPVIYAPPAAVRVERFAPLASSKPTRFEDLPAGRCKWPLGDVMARALVCCGGRKDGEGPYCDPHEAMSRNKPETRRVDETFIRPNVRRWAA